MNTFSKHSRLLIVVLLLGLVGQWVYAQDGTNTPQWVIDRQQYETTFVPISQLLDIVPQMPQWVIDRQQYETTFVYPIGDFPTVTTVLAASAR